MTKPAEVHEHHIMWTRDKLRRFKVDYEAAIRLNVREFTFNGNLFLVPYAAYLIEYLEGRFK